jgi:light-independent protochlorophyllide reductase subunit B
LMMGLEEHLLAMFREDSEFGEGAAPSHLGVTAVSVVEAAPILPPAEMAVIVDAVWLPEAAQALKKIPIFVRSKARRNTEIFARERGLGSISLQTLYDARAHHAR